MEMVGVWRSLEVLFGGPCGLTRDAVHAIPVTFLSPRDLAFLSRDLFAPALP